MDNLTHSLIGAVLGQAGLKRKTGLAMPTLIVAANIPDIDGACMALGTVSLAMRRGITHGPIALLVLPALLTWAMVWFDRRQAQRGTRPDSRLPVRPGWLLALAYIGCLSHPLFDWMNSYGIRLLEPFSHRWFYGDALFIVDPWLLAMLGAGVWFSRRRERSGHPGWQRPAWAGLVGVTFFVSFNLGESRLASKWVQTYAPYGLQPDWSKKYEDGPLITVANPVPFAFWQREVLWRDRRRYGSYVVPLIGSARVQQPPRELGLDDPNIGERAKRSPEAQALLFWSRMPVATREGDAIILHDQRFMDSMTGGRFEVRLEP